MKQVLKQPLLWITRDLQGFINGFHRILFRNDRWILNPALDRLIWLFPARLFQDGAIVLGAWLAGVHVVVTLVAVWGLFFYKMGKTANK